MSLPGSQWGWIVKKRIEQLILKAPYPVRWAAANYMSWRLQQERRGGDRAGIRALVDFRQYFEKPWEQFQDEQNNRLAAYIARIRERVPFYRELYAGLPTIQNREDLRCLPLISKADLRQAGMKATDPELMRQGKYHTAQTSGSTGSPFVYYLTIDALRIRFAQRDMFFTLHGADPDARKLRLGGRLFIDVSITKPPFWLMDYATNQLMFSAYHMSDQTLELFLAPLARYQPNFVTGYPSQMYILAEFCLKRGFDFKMQFAFTDSETVLAHHVETIQKAWGCPVIDYYGMEVGWIAGQWKGKYHLSPLTSVVEILDENGSPQPPGKLGEVVVTDLTNPIMPFIRYRTGDAAMWVENPLDSGWNTPQIERIEGRLDDIVTLPNGRKVGRLDHIFKNAANIRECQIVQHAPDWFDFLLVPDIHYTDADGESVLREAHKRLGEDVRINLHLVDEIQRTGQKKFRAVISKVNS